MKLTVALAFGLLGVSALLLSVSAAPERGNGENRPFGLPPNWPPNLFQAGRRVAMGIGENLWKAHVNLHKYIEEHPVNFTEVRTYTLNVVDRIRKGQLPVCIKIEMPSLDQLREGIKKFYFRTPLPRLVNYVSDNSPEALKTYVADLASLSKTLASDISKTNPPVEQVKQFAMDVMEAAKVFAVEVHDATPTSELKEFGGNFYEAASHLSSQIAAGVPVSALKKEAQDLATAIAHFSGQVANPRNLPYEGLATYAQETFAGIWNNHVSQSAEEDKTSETVQNTDNPDLKRYAEEVKDAASKFYDETHQAGVQDELKKFAGDVKSAAGQFITDVKKGVPVDALKQYSANVLAASTDFAKTAAGAVPKVSLLIWSSKVAAAGAKFTAGVVWKTPFKMQVFSLPMYVASVMKLAKEKGRIPTVEEIEQATKCDFITAAWRMTHNLYVKIRLNNYTATFERIPVTEWSNFIKSKSAEIRSGSIELYTKYGPGTGKPTEFVHAVQDKLAEMGHALQEFYDCADKNGYLELPKAVWNNILNGVGQFLPPWMREHGDNVPAQNSNAGSDKYNGW